MSSSGRADRPPSSTWHYIGSALQNRSSRIDVGSDSETSDSLVNTTNEELYRGKAMFVWWMLRDMVGEASY